MDNLDKKEAVFMNICHENSFLKVYNLLLFEFGHHFVAQFFCFLH